MMGPPLSLVPALSSAGLDSTAVRIAHKTNQAQLATISCSNRRNESRQPSPNPGGHPGGLKSARPDSKKVYPAAASSPQAIPTPSQARSPPRSSSDHQRGSFFLSPSMASSPSYQTINMAPADSPPRLLTFTTKGHGFMWNEELFIPASLLDRSGAYDDNYNDDDDDDDDDDEYDDEDLNMDVDDESEGLGTSYGRRSDFGYHRRRKEYDDDFGDGEGISGEVIEVTVTDDEIKRMMPE